MTDKTTKILLVEDNPADAGLLKASLSIGGAGKFQIVQATRLKEALVHLSNEQFDMLLLDLSLPDSTGLETISTIQKASRRTPIIVLTGNDDEQLGIEAVRKGVQDYLVKGQIPEKLLTRAIEYAVERKQSAEALQTLNEQLEGKVRQRTKDLNNTVTALQAEVNERIRTEQALRASQSQLRSLASELSLVEERERRNIAHLLHEHIGQILAMAKIKIGSAKKSAAPEDRTSLLRDVQELIEEAISSTRSLTLQVSPPMLYTLGLGAAVETVCEKFKIDYGIACSFEDDEKANALSEDFRAVMFRAIGELLSNIAKYAKATHVAVSLRRSNDHLEVKVQDDGIGFEAVDLARPSGETGFGLIGIRERLTHLGGSFFIESAPGKGTTVTLTAPLQKK